MSGGYLWSGDTSGDGERSGDGDLRSCAQPAGIILLVIGAGGVFKQVLVDSGVGPALGEALTGMGLPIAITCFVLAAAVRIMVLRPLPA